jgi:OOP family OmpA-OmpF porin
MSTRSNIFLILISINLSIASAEEPMSNSTGKEAIDARTSSSYLSGAVTSGGYLTDSSGNAVRGSGGECWRAGVWTPALANFVGCDGVLAKALPVPSPATVPEASVSSSLEPEAISEQTLESSNSLDIVEKISFDTEMLFDFNKAALKTEGRQRLDNLASRLLGCTVEVVVAQGHTDSIGSQTYNQQLSEKRAKSVADYLSNKGIPSEKIITEGRGASQPIASNSSEAGRAMNRRVSIEVVTIPARE